MYGNVNSTNALRMLNTLYQANQPPPAPPAPVRAPRVRAPVTRRPVTPPSSDSEEDSEYSDSEVSQSSYEDVDVMYKKVVEEAKCPHVSPAGLKDKKTSKEAAAYLKSKNCPEVPKLKKVKAVKIEEPVKIEIPKVEMEVPAAPKTKRVVKKKVTATEAPAPVAAPAPAPVAAPAAAPAKEGKTKRAPSAYNKFMGEQLRAGKTMQQVAAAWKEQKGSA